MGCREKIRRWTIHHTTLGIHVTFMYIQLIPTMVQSSNSLFYFMLPFVESFHVIHVGVEVQPIPEIHQPIAHVPKPRQLLRPHSQLPRVLPAVVVLMLRQIHGITVNAPAELVSPPLYALEGLGDLRVSVLPPVLHRMV